MPEGLRPVPAVGLSDTERLILDAIQEGFPIGPRPFLELADTLNERHGLRLTEEGLIDAVKALKAQNYLRRLGGIFNSRPLGYLSTLCAARVPEDKLEAFAAKVNSYPQVTHNYVRDNPLNVWFTFSYENEKELKGLLESLRRETAVEEIYELGAKRIFKIRAVFRLSPD
ncbi:MAG: Lrp/AsnC family transcriptional regulator [Deltaproteobacteria bacterium]|jgi:DNA-binding Lrp family transcriptional regulator|nr:Lrp/AsnC family transcriptional regulator [Deltaproteobacteria bacterium]